MAKLSGSSTQGKSSGSGYQGGAGGRKTDYSGKVPYNSAIGANQRMNGVKSNSTTVAKNNMGVLPPPVRRNPYDTMYTPTTPKKVTTPVAPAAKKKAAPSAPAKKPASAVPGYKAANPRPSGPMTSKEALGGLPSGSYVKSPTKFSNGKMYNNMTISGGNGGSGRSVGNYTSGGGSTKAERSNMGRGGGTGTRNK